MGSLVTVLLRCVGGVVRAMRAMWGGFLNSSVDSGFLRLSEAIVGSIVSKDSILPSFEIAPHAPYRTFLGRCEEYRPGSGEMLPGTQTGCLEALSDRSCGGGGCPANRDT